MRTRHKPPALVSMWMLDVFCCALGCVTLLWLLNNRAASEQADRANSSQQDLAAARSALVAAADELAATKRALNAQTEELRAKLVATTSERDETARQLAVARTDITTLETKVAKSDAQAEKLLDELAKKRKDASDLSDRLTAASASTEELRKLLREKDSEAAALALKAKKAEDQLDDADARLRSAAKAAADATADRAALRKTGDELAAARAEAKALQKKLDDANAHIIDLQGDKKKLADKADRLRVESDAKFAGIAMTGRRVCFAVDISGSMKLLDDKTPAPQKWPIVVETVTKVMRTIPDLEQYQVVIFSRRARYLFGDGGWEPFRGEESLSRVRAALLAVDPVGDTNVYEAFELAFRLRPLGLDAVYLFSDGLPTSGAGLTEQQEKTFTEGQRTEQLAKHVRATLNARWNAPGAGARVRINAIGFFFESPEVGAFLWALARENDGSFVGMSRP